MESSSNRRRRSVGRQQGTRPPSSPHFISERTLEATPRSAQAPSPPTWAPLQRDSWRTYSDSIFGVSVPPRLSNMRTERCKRPSPMRAITAYRRPKRPTAPAPPRHVRDHFAGVLALRANVRPLIPNTSA
ncbi:hypothetical protein MRX96_030718 [Rhipicephalus microplus]